eukprot:7683327-Pyramimonas_sp.AAC.1
MAPVEGSTAPPPRHSSAPPANHPQNSSAGLLCILAQKTSMRNSSAAKDFASLSRGPSACRAECSWARLRRQRCLMPSAERRKARLRAAAAQAMAKNELPMQP